MVQIRNYGLDITDLMANFVKLGEKWLGGKFYILKWLVWPISLILFYVYFICNNLFGNKLGKLVDKLAYEQIMSGKN